MLAIDVLGIVAAAGVVLYGLFIAFCLAKWNAIPIADGKGFTGDPFSVSIVVVARNEATTILSLLHDISLQHYPKDLLEVILVDDQSVDSTVSSSEDFASACGMTLKVISLKKKEGDWAGRKKQGIMQAAALAKGDVLLLTDADCRVTPGWVASHIRYYRKFAKAKLVFGAFCFQGNDVFSSLLNIEAMSLTGVASVTNLIGKPTMCSGANLSYRRRILLELNPFDGNRHIASGDDEFMLHAVQKRYPGTAYYNKEVDSLVTTSRPESMMALYHQRRRWAGKWKAYSIPWPLRLALLVVAGNLGFIILLPVVMLSLSPLWLTPIALKWVTELLFSIKIGRNFGLAGLRRYFLLMEIIYPFYAVFFGIASNFGKYRWKGRTYP